MLILRAGLPGLGKIQLQIIKGKKNESLLASIRLRLSFRTESITIQSAKRAILGELFTLKCLSDLVRLDTKVRRSWR